MRALKIVGRAAVAFYEELFFYIALGAGHAASWLLIVPGPYALAGLYTIAQRSVRGLGVSWAIIWGGIREFGSRSLLLFGIIVAGYAVLISNIWFYNTPDISPFPVSTAAWTTPIIIAVGAVWTGVAFYAQSFLMELEDPRIRLVLRNSLFLTLLKPLQTLLFIVVSLVALAVSIAVPILLIASPGFIATLALTAVRSIVGDLKGEAPGIRPDST
ncbi:MAG: hypothetical protein MUF84_13745 [Anaerolineae bacterium]|jgi:hypothetical protein|nr:hypothetical protein [Anaerolineae bacterium]